METEDSLLHSQVPTTCPYPEQEQSERVFYKPEMRVQI